MTFEAAAAELHRLESVALSLGLSEVAFERILLDVTAAAHDSGVGPEQQLAEIRKRIVWSANKKPAAAGAGRVRVERVVEFDA